MAGENARKKSASDAGNVNLGVGASINGLNSGISSDTAHNSMPFDYSTWEEAAEELNFLNEAGGLPIVESPATGAGGSASARSGSAGPGSAGPSSAGADNAGRAFSPINTNSTAAPSPSDYAVQLQQYQNLLLETQQGVRRGSPSATGPAVPAGINGGLNGSAGAGVGSAGMAANALTAPLMYGRGAQIAQAGPIAPIAALGAMGPMAQIGPNQMAAAQMAAAQPFLRANAAAAAAAAASTTTTTKTGRRRRRKDLPQPRTKVRPCDHCRRRKTKCVMIPEIHSCKMCQAKGLKCTFTETTRGLKRGLEDGADGARGSADGARGSATKHLRLEDPTIQSPPHVAVRDVHPVRDYAALPGRSLLKRTLSLQYPRSSFYVGPTSIYDPVFLPRIALDKIDQFTLDRRNSIRKVADTVQFVLRDDFSEALYEKSERDADTVERYVAPHGKALIDLYFRTVHPSFPVLHKKIFLEKYARTHREFGAPLLAAVYLLAIEWWDYDPALSRYAKPNVESLHRFALRAFGDVIRRPKLSAVQAGLLLLQCRTPDQAADKNWLLCAQVVALAEDLGLGLECGRWRLPRWERGLRRRLAWAVYIQDKWCALAEGRPSHIDERTNWLVGKVRAEDFPEKGDTDRDSLRAGSADVDNGRRAFVQMVALSEILAQILDAFYTPAAQMRVTTIQQVLTAAKPLQLRLRDWYHALPEELQMQSLRPRHFNNNGTVQLAYFAVEITLHRRIVAALFHQRDPAPPAQLVRVCRAAARTRLAAAIEFARGLKAEHMQAFWYSSAVHNFALIGVFAALLYVTSATPEEASSYKEQLFDYRWILKVNSRSFDIAARALARVDGLLKNIPGLLQEEETDLGGRPGAVPETSGGPSGEVAKKQGSDPAGEGAGVKNTGNGSGENPDSTGGKSAAGQAMTAQSVASHPAGHSTHPSSHSSPVATRQGSMSRAGSSHATPASKISKAE